MVGADDEVVVALLNPELPRSVWFSDLLSVNQIHMVSLAGTNEEYAAEEAPELSYFRLQCLDVFTC